MSPLLSIVLFLLSTFTVSTASGGNFSDSFFELCPPTRCANTGPIIRFPFRLNTQPSSCGREGYEISCSGNQTVFHLPFSGDYYVKQISYSKNWISLTKLHSTDCPIQSLISLNRSGSILKEPNNYLPVVKCPESDVKEGILGPIDCLRDDNSSVYVMDGRNRIDNMPSHCNMFNKAGFAYVEVDRNESPVERLLRTGEMVEEWSGFGRCYECEWVGKYCGINSTSNGTICSSSQNKYPPCFSFTIYFLGKIYLN